MIIAVYDDNGKLLCIANKQVEIAIFEYKPVPINIPEEAAENKVMIWDSTDTMHLLCSFELSEKTEFG